MAGNIELEMALAPAVVVQHIPELGPDAGIQIPVIFTLCHPESKKPLYSTGIQDMKGMPIYKCEETGERGEPREIWDLLMPLLGWSEGGNPVAKIPKNARLKITVEDVTEYPDETEEE